MTKGEMNDALELSEIKTELVNVAYSLVADEQETREKLSKKLMILASRIHSMESGFYTETA